MSEEKKLYIVFTGFIIIFLGCLLSVKIVSEDYETDSKRYIENNCEFVRNEYALYNDKIYLTRTFFICDGKIIVEEK